MALLGAILVNNRAAEDIDFLAPEHFADPLNGRIFDACRTVIGRGNAANPTTLRQAMEGDAAFRDVGGADYLARLAANAVSLVGARNYADLVHDLYVRRELIAAAGDLAETAHGGDLDTTAAAMLEEHERRLFRIGEAGGASGEPHPAADAVGTALVDAEAALKAGGKPRGVLTGLDDLDAKLGGLRRGDLIIIAGRPGMGKSALGLNIADNAARAYVAGRDDAGNRIARAGAIVALFSLEMSDLQIAQRLLADHLNVPVLTVQSGNIDFNAGQRFRAALADVPLIVDCTPGLSLAAIRSRARRLKRRRGLDLVIIDYLQLLAEPLRAGGNRVEDITYISKGLKDLARELDVPVVALSQLSRNVENRDDKRPRLADLRESGSIEQDADVVIFPYRRAYYLERDKPEQDFDKDPAKYADALANWEAGMAACRNLADIIVAKNRQGESNFMVETYFNATTIRFSNLSKRNDR